MVKTAPPSVPDGRAPGPRALSLWRFAGPAFLVSVGYMDPGNWATDLKGGSTYGHALLWVVLAASLMAILLQTLCVRVGVGSGRDLAQLCGTMFPKPVATVLWILAEVAIVACDVAEVIGSAVALGLLFGLPLWIGVLVTGFDVLVLLALLGRGRRLLEATVGALVATVALCFLIVLAMARPDLGAAGAALVPRRGLGGEALAIAVGILGATVMPHNLYLHSAMARRAEVPEERRLAARVGTWDTVGALSAAFFVNAAILVLAATVFFPRGQAVEDLGDAHRLLTPVLGSLSSLLFAVALLAAGLSSTITGTLAGQIVMEGFTEYRMKPWLRRLLTRGLAIVPAMILVTVFQGRTIESLLVSQIVLSLQLPFAVFPLVWLASRRDLMGDLTSPRWLTVVGYLVAGAIAALNANLLLSLVPKR